MKTSQILCGLTFVLSGASSASADVVELVSINGKTAIARGELIAVQNNSFVVRTKIGVVTVERDSVICKGTACPVSLDQEADMVVAAPVELAEVIMPLLADGFAESQEREALILTPEGIPIGEEVSHESDTVSDYSFNILLTGSQDNEQVNIAVHSANGEGLFNSLAAGDASLIFSEQSASDSAVKAVQQAGGGNLRNLDQERVIAVDGYVAVAHESNPVKSMTVDQVAGILSGEIDNWSELGAEDVPIHVYSFSPNAEAFHHIDDLVLKPANATLSAKARTVKSTRELTRAINDDRFGFGVVKFSSVRDLKAISLVNECGMVTEPTAFNIKTEEYTLQNRVIAYSPRSNSAFASEFLRYLDGPNLDGLVYKAGLVNLGIAVDKSGDERTRLLSSLDGFGDEVSATQLKDFVEDILTTNRISTTFRFAPSSSQLDSKAKRDLTRVLRFVDETNPKRLVLAGFADSNGSYAKNQQLSEARAVAVLNELVAADSERRLEGVELVARGYGEVAPVACNETFDGRATNRRVEVWVE